MQEDTVEDHTHSVTDPGHTHTDSGHSHGYYKMPKVGGTYNTIWEKFYLYSTKREYETYTRTTTGRANISTSKANIRVGSMNTSNKGTETRPKNMIVEWIIKVC